MAGDLIVAINDERVSHAQVERIFSQFNEGECCRVHIFRNNQLLELSTELIKAVKNFPQLCDNDCQPDKVNWFQRSTEKILKKKKE